MAIDDIFEKINNGKVSRRTVLKAGVAAGIGLAGASIAGCTSPSPTVSVTPTAVPKLKDTVRVGYLPSDHDAPLFVAKSKGLFDKYGVKVELTSFQGGSAITTQMLAGTIDIGIAGVVPVILAYDKDPSIKIAAAVHNKGSGLIVKKGSEITTIAQLRGKKIAVPAFGSIQDIMVRMLLEKNGMTDKDVTLQTVPAPQMLQSLDATTIDAYMAWEPFITQAAMQNIGEVLVRFEEIMPDHPCDTVVATKAMITEYTDSLKGFLKAHIEAIDFMKTNPQETAQIVASKDWLNVEAAVEAASLPNMTFMYQPDEAFLSGTESFAKECKKMGLTKNDYDRSQLFDLSVLGQIT